MAAVLTNGGLYLASNDLSATYVRMIDPDFDAETKLRGSFKLSGQLAEVTSDLQVSIAVF